MLAKSKGKFEQLQEQKYLKWDLQNASPPTVGLIINKIFKLFVISWKNEVPFMTERKRSSLYAYRDRMN